MLGPPTRRTRRLPQARDLNGSHWIAVAMAVMNVATYGYQMLAARILGPQSFGAFAALMNLLLTVTVLALALQANAARRIATAPHHVQAVEKAITRVGIQASIGLAVIGLLLTPLINSGLRLSSWPTAALVGLSALPLTLMGYQAGVLQGERRWKSLALVYLSAGVPRFMIGTALLLWNPTPFWAIVGVLLGAWAPVLVGAMALRRSSQNQSRSGSHRSPAGGQFDDPAPTARELWRETLHNSHALFAYFALCNADILVARNAMLDHQAGLYASGLIMTKVVLFLPQFIVVLAFPSMGAAESRRDSLVKGLGAVAVLSVLVAVAAKVLAPVAMVFVGGEGYVAVQPHLWQFAVLGGLLAMIQLLVYGVIARQAKRSIYLLWAGLITLLVVGRQMDSFQSLLLTVLAIDGVVFVVLLLSSLWRLGDMEKAAKASAGAKAA